MIGTFFLCACCNTSTQKEANTIQTTSTAHITLDQNLYQNGLIYTDNAYGANYVCFLDCATMQGVPLCNKPNCTHKDASCVAFQCVGSTADAIHFTTISSTGLNRAMRLSTARMVQTRRQTSKAPYARRIWRRER